MKNLVQILQVSIMMMRQNQRQVPKRVSLTSTIFVALSLLGTFGSASAQRLLPIKRVNPTVRPAQYEEDVPVENSRPREVRPKQNKPISPEQKQLYREADIISHQLTDQAADAFERGLMTLPRYLTHLNMTLQLANQHHDPGVRIAALQDRSQRLRNAVVSLERFNQPGAVGWKADLALAQLTVVDTGVSLQADLLGAVRPETLESITSLIQKHTRLRMNDYDIGHASLQQLTQAASFLYFKSVSPPTIDDYEPIIADLNAVRDIAVQDLRQTNRYAADGAGVGRKDQVLLAQLELARLDAYLAELTNQDDQTKGGAWVVANSTAKQLFETQKKFYQTGTSDIFDLANTIWLRQQVRSDIRGAQWIIPLEMNEKFENDLAELVQTADRISDRRGQNTPNITFVHSLTTLVKLQKFEN